ncbi:MAG: roadblock/LC7 domain-containing protein [Polyangia bacterium]|jgi:predicted regulator of Ras-like GTPase activity (Roadblock/LC7/MglB family)|nr:roadblock/LC7 domain-containing protein [Polyangia bacterium]
MPSLFGELLAELVGDIPGALGAVFIDWEGEAVDQFSHIPVMDILLVGAHWGVVLRQVRELLLKHGWGEPQVLLLNGQEREILIKPIAGEYCVVLAMRSGTHIATALESLNRVCAKIQREM